MMKDPNTFFCFVAIVEQRKQTMGLNANYCIVESADISVLGFVKKCP